MKILLIGNPSHQLLQSLVEKLKVKNNKLTIDIISVPFHVNQNNNCFDNIYNINSSLAFLKNIPILKTIYFARGIRNTLTKLSNYDVISVQIVYYFLYLCWRSIKKKGNKVLLSFWGSDFNNLNKFYNFFLSKFVGSADKISCANSDLKEKIVKSFSLKDNQVFVVRFGLKPLDTLRQISKNLDSQSAKKALGFENHFIITLGYNASKIQQHKIIIEQINLIKHKLPENYLLLLPMTYGYGNTSDYIFQIKSKLVAYGLKHLLYEKFLDENEISQIRIATDLMIQIQIMDQLSGSMQEHLYAGNIIITGKWLPYQVFKEKDVYFIETENPNMLSATLEDTIKNFERHKMKSEGNSEKIWELSSWENCITDWYHFLTK